MSTRYTFPTRRNKFSTFLSGVIAGYAIAVFLHLALHQLNPQAEPPTCPPGHVYLDQGEMPQTGCMPEGVYRDLYRHCFNGAAEGCPTPRPEP